MRRSNKANITEFCLQSSCSDRDLARATTVVAALAYLTLRHLGDSSLLTCGRVSSVLFSVAFPGYHGVVSPGV